MPLHVTCSGCQATLAAPDSAAGKAVRCPKCRAVIAVPAAITPEPNGPPREPLAKKAAPVETLPEVEDDRPRRRRPADDEEDEDRPRRKRDEEEPAPVRRQRPAAKKGNWVLPATLGAVLLGFLLFCGLGGWGAYLLLSSLSEQVAQNAPPPEAVPAAAEAPQAAPVAPPFNPAPAGPPPGNPAPRAPVAPPPAPPVRPAEPPKPTDVLLKMPPLPAAVPIQPPPLKGETTVPLPDTIGALAVGGHGRFLVLHFPKLRKLGVFDVNEAKLKEFIPVGEDTVHFAAGMTKLVIYLPGSNTVQRWDLVTQQREHLGKMPGERGKIVSFCMGDASAGPLLICDERGGVRFHDLTTFEEMPYKVNGQGLGSGPGPIYWAGSDGRIYGATGNYGMPNGVATLVIEGGKVRTHREHWGTWFVQPGPGDKHICAGGHGVLTDRVQPADDVVFSKQSGNVVHTFLPARHGPYYMHVHVKSGLEKVLGPGLNKDDPDWGLTVYMLGDKRPIAQLPNVRVPTYGEWGALQGLGIVNCVHLIPRAHLIAVVPASRDKLLLYPFDVEEALEKSGIKYLLITSQPPASARRGQELTYQIAGKAKAGGLTFQLASGPKGMAVTPQGRLTWSVPPDFADKEADVIVTARDADGQEVFHTFTLAVEDGK